MILLIAIQIIYCVDRFFKIFLSIQLKLIYSKYLSFHNCIYLLDITKSINQKPLLLHQTFSVSLEIQLKFIRSDNLLMYIQNDLLDITKSINQKPLLLHLTFSVSLEIQL